MTTSKTESTEQRVIRLYHEDKSPYEIAEELGTYPNKIRRILKKMGEPLRSRSEAQKAALDTGRKDHPTEGKERSYDDKVKISRSLTEHWAGMSDNERQEKVDQAKARWEALPQSKRDEIYDAAIQAIKKAGSEGSKFEKFLYEKLLVAHTVEFHKKNLIPNENFHVVF